MVISSRIDQEVIKCHLPHFRAKSPSSCGAASVLSLAIYYGFGPQAEAPWRKILGTDEWGTPPRHIVRSLRHFGLSVSVRKNLQVEELTENLDKGYPIICPIQAWGSYEKIRNIDSGHYVIVIGYDDKNLYIEDSHLKRTRGWISKLKFFNRWHDTDFYGEYLCQMGMIIKCPWKPVKEYRLFKMTDLIC
jgi:predicted double-glycine peptidase